MKKVLVIVGPTASGKSDLAVRLAKKLNGEIVSADSRQVYRGMNVGSGKVTRKEMAGVPHHLLDVADPKKQFTAAQYKTLAEKALERIESKKKLPIIVGGTGFYIDALTGAAHLPDVPPNPKLRKRLSKKSSEELFKILKKKDPARAKTIDKHNKVRLVRALEIGQVIGKVPQTTSPLLPSPNKGEGPGERKFIFVGIKPAREEIDKKILIRLQKRVPGIIREIKRLHAQGVSWKRLYDFGLEYRYVSLYVRGQLTKEEMVQKLFTEIKRYSKRQVTWFKKNKAIQWYPLGTSLSTYTSDIRRALSKAR